MEQTKPPPRCGYVGSMTYGRMTGGDPVPVSKPAPCWSDATHIVNGEHLRCPDHLVALLDGSPGETWRVARLDAPLGVSLDDRLEQAGIPRTMSGLFEHHATLAQRVELLISQRDRLDEALAWLDADPRRLSLLAAERERQIAAIRSEIARWPSYRDRKAGLSIDDQVEMQVPSVRQVLASMLEPISVDREQKRAEHEAVMDRISELGAELDAIDERTKPPVRSSP